MTSKGHALAREELVRVLTAYSGITTADGAVGGTTLIDANLIGRNDFITEKTILIMSGDAKDEDKGAASFAPLTGRITLQDPGFSAQIKAGTIFRVLNISSIEIDVDRIDTKIGTNVDAAGTTTLFAWLAKLFDQGGQGLVYYGKVTMATMIPVPHFEVSGLIGFGDNYFKDFRAYVVRDAAGAGAAPQGEMQTVTSYGSSAGSFTHAAFTVPLTVDDEVLILHERLAEIADLLADIGDASASTLGSIYAILGNPAQTFLAMIGYEGATSLANKLTAARAVLLDQITTARMAELDAANLPATTDTILLDTQIRRIASGSKTIASGATKHLGIDSGTNGAEILAIIIKGVVSAAWTLEIYVPTDDAVAGPAAGDKRSKITYAAPQTEGGLLDNFGIAYNCFLDFTNDGAASDDIDDVVVVYRSRAVLTLTWEA